MLRLCCYQQGYSRFTNVSIILRLYEAVVAFLLYAILFIHSVRNIFFVSLLNYLFFKMSIRWFDIIAQKVKSQIAEEAVKIVREKQLERLVQWQSSGNGWTNGEIAGQLSEREREREGEGGDVFRY